MEKYIPEGYKQTGIGEIPEDWVYKKISELTNIFGRIGFRGYTKRDIVEVGKGAISISPSNILDTRINYEKCTFISWYKYEESPEIQIVNNDVILVKTGSTFGKAALIHNLPNKATINPQLVVFKDIRIPNIYLSYLINSKIVQNQIQKNVVGGAIPTLSQAMVKNFVVPIPHSRREQESIARALSDVDNLITSLEQLIEKKKAIKQGTMQELLTGRRRLKGFGEGKGYKQTELGMIPEDWEIKSFGDFGNCYRGVSYDGENDLYYRDTSNSVRLLRANNLKQSSINFFDMQFVNQKRVGEIQILQENDIVICMANGSKQLVGKVGLFIPPDASKYTFGAFMGCYRIHMLQVNPKFIFYKFQEHNYRNQLDILLSGSSINNLKPSDIMSIQICIPSQIEQQAIEKTLSDMDLEIINLENKVDKYKQIKQGMMQNLLTGRIRLV